MLLPDFNISSFIFHFPTNAFSVIQLKPNDAYFLGVMLMLFAMEKVKSIHWCRHMLDFTLNYQNHGFYYETMAALFHQWSLNPVRDIYEMMQRIYTSFLFSAARIVLFIDIKASSTSSLTGTDGERWNVGREERELRTNKVWFKEWDEEATVYLTLTFGFLVENPRYHPEKEKHKHEWLRPAGKLKDSVRRENRWWVSILTECARTLLC